MKKRKFNFFLATLLVILFAFSFFADFEIISDFEIENIENFVDGENENKDQEKLETSEKDVFLSMPFTFKLSTNINCLYNNQDLIILNNLYFKIPTPPPDIV